MEFRCGKCGYRSLKWLGHCPECGEWGSFSEHESEDKEVVDLSSLEQPQRLADISAEAGGRWASGIDEFDRILGGGAIIGSTILVGGEPGIGKSTLMLAVAGRFAEHSKKPILYISGEEALPQIKSRAQRLSLDASQNLYLLNEQRLAAIHKVIGDSKPGAVIVDSIQTIFPGSQQNAVGTTQQVGEVAFQLSQLAKSAKIPIFLIGHITKSGEFAGPKAIEHLVDVALYIEGGRDNDIRILRAVKNRYGSTEEIGVFQMGESGMREIQNPSDYFVERTGTPKPGSIVSPSLEGTRPILVEIQALVASTRSNFPQRRSTGLDHNRVALILAVIEKRLGYHISGDDVYLNVIGGINLREPAMDLAIASAIVSSYKNKSIDANTIVLGEIGLSGELRRVKKTRQRLSEAAKLGYTRGVIPVTDGESIPGIEIIEAGGLEEAIDSIGF